MIWKLAAESALALHAAWVLFYVLGPLWCWRRPFWRRLHLGMMLLTLAFTAFLGACPLTRLESLLWLRAGEGGYGEGFLAHWLGAVVYWDVAQWKLTLASVLWLLACAAAYARLWLRERKA